MRKLNRMIAVLFFVSGLITVLAQSTDTVRTRAMFTKKKADGLEIKVMRNDNGQFVLVDPGQEFRAGDEIRVQFRSNFAGKVYFVNVAPSGISRVIYQRQILANEMNDLPANPDVITFDKETGVEVLKIVMARQPVPVFEEALKKSNGELGKSAASVADELAGHESKTGNKLHTENVGIVQPDNKSGMRCRGLELALGSGIRCRGLELAPGNEKKGEGAVAVAIPDDKSRDKKSGELKAGEVAVLELRLKHVQ